MPVQAGHEEEARASLLAVVPTGFEEVEAGGALTLVAYANEEQAAAITSTFPNAVVGDVQAGWEDAWREFHRPVVVAGVWIGPPWHEPPSDVGVVVIDPGRAFGTGAHPTTRLCVELLARCERGSLLDVGCGSGVLAIAGARLGFRPVHAVDDDEIAVETTVRNAVVNAVDVTAHVVDAMRGELPVADVGVVNVLLGPVEEVLPRLATTVAVTSGYLAGERPRADGWRHVETLELGGWAADRFRRVPS